MIIRRADTGAGHVVDVRIRSGLVTHVAPHLSPDPDGPDEEVLDADGGALLPGLHDHHIHLLSLAAGLDSISCATGDLATQIRQATGTSWIRAIGYHESQAGPLDRWHLDAIEPTRPVRVQHRSGALWIVNSPGVQTLGLDTVDLPGIERTTDGTPTGRLWRLDAWLHTRLGTPPPNLVSAADLLLGYGITGVTDATPDLTAAALPGFPLDVQLLGRQKILLPDHDLPSFPELVAQVWSRRPRPVAVHCVTRESLVLTLAALDEAGSVPGDRIEHGSVVPSELFEALRRLGVRVVTQPTFVADRGDEYLAEVDADDLPHLYRYASLLAAGIPTAPSSDAPFGDPDPWRTMAAARDRRTRSGKVVGADERVSTSVVLAGFLAPLDDPGGSPRRIEPGAPADLCLLHEPLAAALARPSSDLVRRTFTRKEVT